MTTYRCMGCGAAVWPEEGRLFPRMHCDGMSPEAKASLAAYNMGRTEAAQRLERKRLLSIADTEDAARAIEATRKKQVTLNLLRVAAEIHSHDSVEVAKSALLAQIAGASSAEIIAALGGVREGACSNG
jgi:hypothetical protein